MRPPRVPTDRDRILVSCGASRAGRASSDASSGDPVGEPLSSSAKSSGSEATELIETLRRAITFEHLVVSGDRVRGIGTGTLLWCSWPDHYRRAYLSRRIFEADPVVEALRIGSGIVTPAHVAAVAARLPGAERAMGLLAEANMSIPFGFVLREGGRIIGALTVTRREPFTATELAALASLGPAIHQRLATPRRLRASGTLSAREVECLSWATNGKTSWEIGAILGISEHTVIAHLASATRKLDATNRMHAIARAFRLGILS